MSRSIGAQALAEASPEGVPDWAFVVMPADPSSASAPTADERPRRVPGSDRAFTPAQLADLFTTPDWHPAGHPPMPEVVAFGRKPDVFACGYCHLPNGQGRPENSSLTGLSARYITEQVRAFRDGLRRSSEPRHLPTAYMVSAETKVSEPELEAAAQYFAGLKPRPWIRVLETDRVARTRVGGWMLVRSGEAGTEPIGARIIELPEDLERTELRDDTAGFVAYVPAGSVRKGEALVVAGGGGRTVPCASCHGAVLRGGVDAPPLAGRSPSYIVRQLYDFKYGARHGPGAKPMQAAVAGLTVTDMTAIAAYTASLDP